MKYTGKATVLSFLSQIFSNCGPLKKDIHIKVIWRRSGGASWNYTL